MDERLELLAKQLMDINGMRRGDFQSLVAERKYKIENGHLRDAMVAGAGSMTATLGAAAVLVTAAAGPVVFYAALGTGALLFGKFSYSLLQKEFANHTRKALTELRDETIKKHPAQALSPTASSFVASVWSGVRARFAPAALEQERIKTSAIADVTHQTVTTDYQRSIGSWRRDHAVGSLAALRWAVSDDAPGNDRVGKIGSATQVVGSLFATLEKPHFNEMTISEKSKWLKTADSILLDTESELTSRIAGGELPDVLAAALKSVHAVREKIETFISPEAKKELSTYSASM